ncbi:MAG TPA: DUF5652 family protein [Candidatus Paceibacterota bacterium]|nr:DUF5652 family protein [Candidatus Paceibacterota bacterium]
MKERSQLILFNKYLMFNSILPASSVPANVWLILALIWSLPWKGVALWKAANKKDKWWFIALLVINTLAILEILYIFYFSKMGEKKDKGGKDN